MISFLKGKVLVKGASAGSAQSGFIILRVGDIGYKVFVNLTMLANLAVDSEAEVYTHQHVREDALDLFGFNNLEELEMFELLISISGVGPRTALGVLSVGSVTDIKESIARGDSNLLTKVAGIGKKTAERVVLELRGKVSALSGRSESQGSAMGDEIDALIVLGYSMSEAREALRNVDSAIIDSGARIKEALKKMGK